MSAAGGPEVLEWQEQPLASLSPGEVRLRQSHAGLNFADLMQRSGAAPVATPAILGLDGVGVVEERGRDVTRFEVGDRVAYTMLPGAYVEIRNIPAARGVAIPADIPNDLACALISKGLTARYLLNDIRTIGSGATILVHAASGGVGSLLCQWASSRGITVIGTVSRRSKAAVALESGCSDVIVRDEEDCIARIIELTGGAKVDVVFDSLGASTFMASLDCLKPRGLLASYGSATGAVPRSALQS